MRDHIGTPEPVHLVHQNDVEFLLTGLCEKPFPAGPIFKGDRARDALIAVDIHKGNVVPLAPGPGKVDLCLDTLPFPLPSVETRA